MKFPCRVRLVPGGPMRRGVLTDEKSPEHLQLLTVVVDGMIYWPNAVDRVYVDSSCPVEMLDAAVECGFFVLGQPRKHA